MLYSLDTTPYTWFCKLGAARYLVEIRVPVMMALVLLVVLPTSSSILTTTPVTPAHPPERAVGGLPQAGALSASGYHAAEDVENRVYISHSHIPTRSDHSYP